MGSSRGSQACPRAPEPGKALALGGDDRTERGQEAPAQLAPGPALPRGAAGGAAGGRGWGWGRGGTPGGRAPLSRPALPAATRGSGCRGATLPPCPAPAGSRRPARTLSGGPASASGAASPLVPGSPGQRRRGGGASARPVGGGGASLATGAAGAPGQTPGAAGRLTLSRAHGPRQRLRGRGVRPKRSRGEHVPAWDSRAPVPAGGPASATCTLRPHLSPLHPSWAPGHSPSHPPRARTPAHLGDPVCHPVCDTSILLRSP